MQRQSPATTASIDRGIALEDLVGNPEFVEVLGQQEATDARTDDEDGKISHGGQQGGTDSVPRRTRSSLTFD